MKTSRFLDFGIGAFLVCLTYVLGQILFPLERFNESIAGSTFKAILDLSALVMVPSIFYVLWHMITNRHPYWLALSLIFAPVTIPAYYYGVARRSRLFEEKDAQQCVPADRADRPRSG